ncbi:MAG TPA: MBL fold metallo-hydrolase [Fimbriimonadaceae bacterium]|nr:MBL fold metallo-hydrolase [Fimbriimonadaceae bacterium]
MAQSIQFLGAARTVTGSKHLITHNGKKILIDCGLFQGGQELSARNWLDFEFDPATLDLVILTHAHMDHIGMLPNLVKAGYRGPIICTAATLGLARISLPDSGRIQEEDARHANKHGYSRHSPALPLYTEKDAYACLKQFQKVHYYDFRDLPGGGTWRFLPAGHILGSAFIEIYFENGERILMGGDLGRFDTPIIKDPTTVEFAEYLVIESTYGDRSHAKENIRHRLATIITQAVKDGTAILTPSFSIGRTQELLYHIHQMQDQKRIPRIPIFVDSPMAVSSTQVYRQALEEHDDEMKAELDMAHEPLEPENLTMVRDREQSKALNVHPGPMMVIAGSGMCNGGRIVHHLLHRLSSENTLVLFTGYQAEGTLGRRLIEGADVVTIHGREVEVRARVDKLNSLSAHCDADEMMRWLGGFKVAPKKTFIVHGEIHAQEALQARIQTELGWETEIPYQADVFDLE